MSEETIKLVENMSYDLQPTPGKPSIHVIPDEIMLHIFHFLSMDTVMELEFVCRRWRHLCITYYRNQLIRRKRRVVFSKEHAEDEFCDSYKKLYKIFNFAGDLVEKIYFNCYIRKFPFQLHCCNLTVLRVRYSKLSPEQIREIGLSCSKLEYFTLLPIRKAKLSFTEFHNLKELKIYGDYYSVNLTPSLSTLEILILHGSHMRWDINSVTDFSLFKNIKKIEIATPKKDRCSMISLSKCKNLQRLYLGSRKGDYTFRWLDCIEEIIKNCHELRKLEIPFFEMTSKNIPKFVNAIKNRKLESKLYLYVSIKWKVMDELYKLEAANYVVKNFYLQGCQVQ